MEAKGKLTSSIIAIESQRARIALLWSCRPFESAIWFIEACKALLHALRELKA
jgi:hypothetical protein